MSNSNPSLDPANNGTLTGLLKHAYKKLMQDTGGMLPARVIAFDRGPPARVQVQPMVALISTSGDNVQRAQIASIPVLQIGGGGYLLSFNLKPGDLGWIIPSTRDISVFLQTYQDTAPNTERLNNFADSLFIPDVMRGYDINAEDAEHAVLQKDDGSVRIALWPDKVKITAPNGLLVEGPLEVSGPITANSAITANGGMSCSGGSGPNSFTVTGDLRTVGNITASGNIDAHIP